MVHFSNAYLTERLVEEHVKEAQHTAEMNRWMQEAGFSGEDGCLEPVAGCCVSWAVCWKLGASAYKSGINCRPLPCSLPGSCSSAWAWERDG